MPRHGEAFLKAREPRVIFVHPEPEWVLDNYRVRTWYYRDAPNVGDKVTYMRDGFSTRISHVNFSRIYFEDAGSMRRPFVGRRMGAWLLPRLHLSLNLSRLRAVRSRATSTLRPDAATLYV